MWPLAVLFTWSFLYENVWPFSRAEKSGRNNEVTRPDYRGGRKVGFHCTMVLYIIYYCACMEYYNRTFIVSPFS